ncbi:MAG: hypothetical protein A2X94_16825 [Bdellovibrionales bacterium GWB1_55_8]|nr:MAG: hypothetical protein A2X94_16825 [Bdellovibrionales bacterium GWB1_55_8]
MAFFQSPWTPFDTDSGGRKVLKLKSLKNQAVIADKCIVAERFLDRLRGLIGRTLLASGEGMLFPRCNDVHMWFMRIPIDIVFLTELPGIEGSRKFKVCSVREQAMPWRLLPLRDGRAEHTLELPAGTVRAQSIHPGDELCIA